jgi:hypothetical protein
LQFSAQFQNWRGVRVQRNSVPSAAVEPESVLEPGDLRAGPEPARAHDRFDSLDVLFFDPRRAEDQKVALAPYIRRGSSYK